jgi:hypothetical protein
MAEYVRKQWNAQFHGMSRRDRRGGSYEVYLPDLLLDWNPTLTGDLAADIADAEVRLLRQVLQHLGVPVQELDDAQRTGRIGN